MTLTTGAVSERRPPNAVTLAFLMMTAVAVAVAYWLWPASVHIVNWNDTGIERIALLAPLTRLGWSVAAAVVVAFAVWWWTPPADEAQRTMRYVAAPLLTLSACAVPYLPWLPDRVPVLLIFAGPLRWAVASGAVAWCLARWARTRSWSSATLTVRPTTVFVISLVVYAALGLRSLSTIGLKGDEPHYLIISQSLFSDGDLQIENNHRQREYRHFTREDPPPDYMQRGKDGAIYSIHAPGLPAILLPAYAIAGHYGAVLVLCAIAALAALAIHQLATLTAGAAAAFWTWLAIAFAVPFMPYAWSVFPEMPGAALVGWAAVWMAEKAPVSNRRWLARGFALALLPWLHTKFVVLLAGLVAVLLLVRLRTRIAAALAFLAPIAGSSIAWLASFYLIYGTFDPQAPYGNYARDWVRTEFVARGVLGLLIDQKFGLIPYAPIYLLVPVGLWFTMRNAKWRWLVGSLTLLAVAYTVSSARLYMWWGGWSAPARFLVPALPLLAPPLAVGFAATIGSRWRAVAVLLVVISLAFAVVSATMPERLLLFSDAHGVSRLASVLQGPAPLTATLPMFTESEWRPRDLIPRGYPPVVRQRVALEGRIALLDRLNDGAFAHHYGERRRLELDDARRAGIITADLAPAAGPPPLAAENAYMEGDAFWTVGTERARVVIPTRGHENLRAEVHIGPTGGVCRTKVLGEQFDERLAPNQTVAVQFRVPPATAWVAVAVQASDAFRPADVDAQSGDQRLLGCQVRVQTW